jgi:hypothetical protein
MNTSVDVPPADTPTTVTADKVAVQRSTPVTAEPTEAIADTLIEMEESAKEHDIVVAADEISIDVKGASNVQTDVQAATAVSTSVHTSDPQRLSSDAQQPLHGTKPLLLATTGSFASPAMKAVPIVTAAAATQTVAIAKCDASIDCCVTEQATSPPVDDPSQDGTVIPPAVAVASKMVVKTTVRVTTQTAVSSHLPEPSPAQPLSVNFSSNTMETVLPVLQTSSTQSNKDNADEVNHTFPEKRELSLYEKMGMVSAHWSLLYGNNQ